MKPQKWQDYLFGSNIWVSLSAVSHSFIAIHLTQKSWSSAEVFYLGWIFCSCLAIYTIHRHNNSSFIDNKRFNFYKSNAQMKIVTLIVFLVALLCFIAVEWRKIIFLGLPMFLLTLLYIFPLIRGRKLRDFSMIKVLIIPLVWCWFTVLIPWILVENKVDHNLIIIFVSSYIFIWLMCIPFDVRDRFLDQAQGTQTIGTNSSIKEIKIVGIACFILLILGLFTAVRLVPQFPASYAYSLVAVCILGLAAFNCIDYSKSHHWYTFIFDGLIIIWGLLFAIITIL